MSKLISIVIVAALAWYGYSKYQERIRAPAEPPAASGTKQLVPEATATSDQSRFRCDGRTLCSQMNSCEEATFFLKNCPGTKMDGNNDGVPCESQWCKR